MFDAEYLKKKCSEYSIPDLIKTIYVQSHDFLPEALAIYTNELKKRVLDIKDFLTKEFLKTGSVEHTVPSVQTHIKNQNSTAEGNLYLTSNGIFFIPENVTNQIAPYGVGAMHLGALGLILDEIILSVSKKDLSTNTKPKDLPLSLLVDIVEYSYAAYINQIEIIDYWTNGRFEINTRDNGKIRFILDKSNLDILKDWMVSHSIKKLQKQTFWQKLLK